MNGKRIIVKSKAQYRGIFILETADEGLVIFLGMLKYYFAQLTEATAFIDAWYAASPLVGCADVPPNQRPI
jgi:hypothetical protein